MKRIILTTFLAMASTMAIFAQNLRECVSLRLNDDDGVYAKGQKIQLWADVKEVPATAPEFDMALYGDAGRTSTRTVALEKGANLLYEGTFDEAIHYSCTLRIGEDGAEPTADRLKAGFIVAPEDFKMGFEEPKDVRKYWKKEFKKMREERMDPVISNRTVEEGYETYHLDLNCVGPAPVRAYVSHPVDAKKKSLPIILNLHAAGKPGSASKASVALGFAKKGALAMDLNAHGMLDDQPKAYYDSLSNGPLNGYSSREPKDRDDYYFKWMFLRAERALDYLMADPLWDGKHIIVMGTSQGGGQSSFLAGINPHVTAAILTVPAMLDQGGALNGRTNSWPKTMARYPETSAKNSPYFDPGLILKHSKANIWCEIGLFDMTCPPANLFATMNTVKKTDKVVVTWQRPHHSNGFNAQEHKELDRRRDEFLSRELTR